MNTVNEVKDWAILPYNTEKINDHYLISNVLGSWDLLDFDEFKCLEQFSLNENDELFNKLYDKGLIIKEKNLTKLINEYRELNSHLFTDASLHIAVLTTRCNIACNYCQSYYSWQDNRLLLRYAQPEYQFGISGWGTIA